MVKNFLIKKKESEGNVLFMEINTTTYSQKKNFVILPHCIKIGFSHYNISHTIAMKVL